MTEEQAWQLIILKLSGEATPAQLAELDAALQQHPEYGANLQLLQSAWYNKKQREPLDTSDSFNRHLQRLSNHLSDEALKYEHPEPVTGTPPVIAEGNNNKSIYRRLAAAGAIAASLTIGIVLLYNREGKTTPAAAPAAAENLVSTRNGSKTKLQLPDGTEVWLNSGSRISYGNDFTGATREVTLKGEAFFDVVKDPARPFIIHTDAIDIKVLGTAFNVRSYPEEKITETALIRGSVEITLRRSPDKRIVLKPSEKLIVKNDSTSVQENKEKDALAKPSPLLSLTKVHYVDRTRDSSTLEMLWTKNKLVFDGETLQEVALKLERWYGVHVAIQSDKLKNTEYNGVFEDENISEVLYALQLTGNFNYSIKKKEVIIRP